QRGAHHVHVHAVVSEDQSCVGAGVLEQRRREVLDRHFVVARAHASGGRGFQRGRAVRIQAPQEGSWFYCQHISCAQPARNTGAGTVSRSKGGSEEKGHVEAVTSRGRPPHRLPARRPTAETSLPAPPANCPVIFAWAEACLLRYAPCLPEFASSSPIRVRAAS